MLPTPLRWVGMEFVRFVHWLDHIAGRSLVGVRSSPAWFFVSVAGTFCVGLTIALFISLAEPHSTAGSSQRVKQTVAVDHSRQQLEKNYDWATQDRWRVAHLFVAEKPMQGPKNIQIDSRLNAAVANAREWNSRFVSTNSSFAGSHRSNRDFDVRLDLSRPDQAEQDNRVVRGTVRDTEATAREKDSRIRRRDPQLLVQAAWEFGPDCRQFNYVGLPARRRIPVAVPIPQPEPETPVRPTRKTWPDLSYEMEMIRHNVIAGAYPPGSDLVSHSKVSAFSSDDPRFQVGYSSNQQSDWNTFNRSQHTAAEDVTPYAGIGIYDPLAEHQTDVDDSDLTLPAAAEVELRMELRTPRSVAYGKVNQSKLFVSNEGTETVARIVVKDLLSHLQTVISANPDALIEEAVDSSHGSQHRNLHREIQGLAPKDGREFDLNWIATTAERQFHRVQVIAYAAVASLTEVTPPSEPDQPMQSIPPEKLPEKHAALACDIQYFEIAYVGEEVDLQIAVRNTGDTELHDVKVRIEIPEQFSHRDGKSVVIDAGTLPVSGRSEKILKMSAVRVGDTANQLRVAAAERIEARGKARIAVVEREKESPAVPPVPETMKSQPQKATPAPKAVTPIPSQPVNNCYCQEVSMTDPTPLRRMP